MTTEPSLDARYGRRPRWSARRRAVWTAVGLVALTAGTLFVWSAFLRTQPGVQGLTVSYEVVSDTAVAVRIEVTKPAGRASQFEPRGHDDA
jgi:hypothetical protein